MGCRQGWDIEPECARGAPEEILRRIQEIFRREGLFGRDIRLRRDGAAYRVRCDETAFVVYRVNEPSGLPPGDPGWPVCRVDAREVYEERRAPNLKECCLSCTLCAADWLEAVRRELART